MTPTDHDPEADDDKRAVRLRILEYLLVAILIATAAIVVIQVTNSSNRSSERHFNCLCSAIQ